MSTEDERIERELSLLGGPEEEAAVRFLRESGPGVLPLLQSAFAREQRVEVRSAMLRVVREIGDPSSLPFLVSLVGEAPVLIVWSVLFEIVAPRLPFIESTADPLDIFFYALGALVAACLWNLYVTCAGRPSTVRTRGSGGPG